MRLHLDNLDSLTPKTQTQRVIRIRPGVIAERGAIDVAMERFELRDLRGKKYRQEKSHYQQAEGGKGYKVELLSHPRRGRTSRP